MTDADDNVSLAKAHCEIWKGNSVAADPFNLKRSLELYTSEYRTKHFILLPLPLFNV